MIYTISNGQYYVKAAKVTVMAAADVADRYQYDILPMGWMVENSMLFIYGNDLGTITAEGQTVQAILPNGTTRSVFIPYGMLFTGIPNVARYGNVYYAVLDENGNVISVEYICNVFNVFDGVAGDELLQLTGDTYLDYAADGTVTIQGKLGITYTSKIDVITPSSSLTMSLYPAPTSRSILTSTPMRPSRFGLTLTATTTLLSTN